MLGYDLASEISSCLKPEATRLEVVSSQIFDFSSKSDNLVANLRNTNMTLISLQKDLKTLTDTTDLYLNARILDIDDATNI